MIQPFLIFFWVVLWSAGFPVAPAQAQHDIWGLSGFASGNTPDINFFKPRTKAGVLHSYNWFVHRKNGINREEARLIVQYVIVTNYLDGKLDYRKPKVVGEDASVWKVRVPARFDLITQKAEEVLFCVDKRSGRIVCQKPRSP